MRRPVFKGMKPDNAILRHALIRVEDQQRLVTPGTLWCCGSRRTRDEASEDGIEVARSPSTLSCRRTHPAHASGARVAWSFEGLKQSQFWFTDFI